MSEFEENSKEWIRHVLKSIDALNAKVDTLQSDFHQKIGDMQRELASFRATCPNHLRLSEQTIKDVEDLKKEMNILKGQDPTNRIEDHINQGRVWRLAIIGEAILILTLIGSGLYNYGKLNAKVDHIVAQQNQIVEQLQKDSLPAEARIYE